MNLEELKKKQRAAGIAARCRISAQERAEAETRMAERVLALPEFCRAQTILSYCAAGGEIDPAAIDRAARALGKRVAYPVCRAGGEMLAAEPESLDSLQAGKYGIPAPTEGHYTVIEPEKLNLIFVPCTAFDANCGRVGMGGGYYDRFLPRAAGAFSVLLAFEAQRVERVGGETHDVSTAAAVTERALYCKK